MDLGPPVITGSALPAGTGTTGTMTRVGGQGMRDGNLVGTIGGGNKTSSLFFEFGVCRQGELVRARAAGLKRWKWGGTTRAVAVRRDPKEETTTTKWGKRKGKKKKAGMPPPGRVVDLSCLHSFPFPRSPWAVVGSGDGVRRPVGSLGSPSGQWPNLEADVEERGEKPWWCGVEQGFKPAGWRDGARGSFFLFFSLFLFISLPIWKRAKRGKDVDAVGSASLVDIYFRRVRLKVNKMRSVSRLKPNTMRFRQSQLALIMMTVSSLGEGGGGNAISD
ncbi:hypothetical protein B0I37DRAFT_384908 [Chaetomium sp. MPI-CAGE-AT-0009]|nr:hypothetical protein B0I37DRAFT_384908 [Chaetomium sp. MPI-CAGE-AT-0009]